MTAPSPATLFRRRLINFMLRALGRLRFFPFSLVLVLLTAGLHALHLHRRAVAVKVARIPRSSPYLTRDVMIWLDAMVQGTAGKEVDVCLWLPDEPDAADLHHVVSAMLAFDRFRSLGLYWDSSSLADDLRVWGGNIGSRSFENPENLEKLLAPDNQRSQQFLEIPHAQLMLPVAVARDMLTYVKRHAAGCLVACLNLPAPCAALAEDVAKARPDVWFLDMASPVRHTRIENLQTVCDHGLTLHERMGLIRAADAYAGVFDELACTAVICERPALMMEDGKLPAAALPEILQFLSTQLRPASWRLPATWLLRDEP